MIIWLASYPKSGNTWVRSFLSAYYYSHDGKFNFELLENIKQFPSKDFLSQRLRSIDEAAENWLIAQKKIKDQNEFCFLKTHNVYGAYKGKNFTTPDFTLGAIYIVRDPRNVLTSLMNHYSLTEDDALKMINSIYRNLRDENNNDDYSSYSFISSWANNYKSWKMSKIINKLIVKYEDLENQEDETFLEILNFTDKVLKKNIKVDQKKFRLAIETTKFDILKKKKKMKDLLRQFTQKKMVRIKSFLILEKRIIIKS